MRSKIELLLIYGTAREREKIDGEWKFLSFEKKTSLGNDKRKLKYEVKLVSENFCWME